MSGTDRLLKVKAVSDMTTFSRSTIWRKVQLGEFPAPLKISQQRTAWRQSDILAWIDRTAAAAA